MRNFSNFFDGYLKYSKGHESTPRVRLWSAVSILAASLERRVFLDRAYYKLFPNLYTFIIGKSGLIKKSTSTGIAVNLLREVPGIKIMAERMTAASIIEQLSSAGKNIEINGVTLGQSAVFAYASELAVFLTEVFGSVTELLTTFYDCQMDATKPWVYHTIGRGQRKIFGPCLNILGASTKAWLKKCIPRSEMEGGFTSRIIFVVENNLPEELVAWPKLTDEDEINRLKLIEDLKDIYTLSGEMKVTQEVHDLFTKWYHKHSRVIIPKCNDARMIGYLSRKGDTILKLCMVHSAARNNKLLITKEDLIWAYNSLNGLEEDWKSAFDGIGSESRLYLEILEFVRDRSKVAKEELLNNFNNRYEMADVVKAIRDLKGNDEIEDYIDQEKIEYYVIPLFEDAINIHQ